MTFNLNIVCAIAASWFLFDFVYNGFKSAISKKDLAISAFILASSLIISFLSLANFTGNFKAFNITYLVKFFIQPHAILLAELIGVYIISMFTIKNFYLWTFLIYTNILLTSLFGFAYEGRPHLYIFFFIYIIVFLWISTDNKFWKLSFRTTFLTVVFAAMLLYPLNSKFYYMFNVQRAIKTKALVNFINNDDQFRNSRIYIPTKIQFIIPYLKDDIELYNICNLKPYMEEFWESTHCVKHPELKIGNDKKMYI